MEPDEDEMKLWVMARVMSQIIVAGDERYEWSEPLPYMPQTYTIRIKQDRERKHALVKQAISRDFCVRELSLDGCHDGYVIEFKNADDMAMFKLKYM
jgi:hypothetical protein